MDKTKKFDLKTLLTVLAAFALALSMIFVTACNNNSSSSSSSSSSSASTETTPTDYQTITNGDFEFGTASTDSDSFPVSSGINWTRANDSLSTSAVSSDYSSGIIDTDDEKYNVIASGQDFPILSGEGDDAVYYNPHTPYYYGLIENSYVYDEDVENEDGLPTTGTKILMIHNKVTSDEGRGTAQKFTSTRTLDIAADSYNLVSVWVLTKDLKTVQDTTEFGAYISLTNTVSSSKNPLVIKNINTNGAWAKINIYIAGSSLVSSSYKIVLGLGTGSRKIQEGYVEGFAYFDNVTYKSLTAKEYEAAVANISDNNSYSLFVSDEDNEGLYRDATAKELQASLVGETYISNGDKSDAYDSTKAFTSFNYSLTYDIPSKDETSVYASSKLNSDAYPAGGSTFGANAQIGSASFSEISSKLEGVTNPISNTAETVYMIYPEVASYTLNTKNFTLKDGESMLLTFYAKVKAENSQTGVTVSLVDRGTTDTVIEEATEISSSFNTNSYENDDSYDWVKFFIYVTNNIGDGKDRNFSIKVDFGPTEATTDYFKFPEGYALFTGFKTTLLSEDQYSIASSDSSYTGTVALGKDLVNGAESEDANKDSYSLSYSKTDTSNIESALSTSVINYTGVVGGHTMVGGENTAFTQESTVSGIFNTKYIDNYTNLTAEEIASLKTLEAEDDNDYVQALLINNKTAASYGYLGSSLTISASSTATISVKLKVFGNAKAYVYLANADQLEGFGVLGLSANKWTFDGSSVTYSSDEFAISKEYVQTVTASECANGWVEVKFQITAGINDITYRVEVWNGSRDGSELSEGMVVLESVDTSSSITTAQLKADNEGGEVNETEYKRVPTLVTYTDDDGNEATKYTQYNSSVVWTEYTKAKTIIATHATVDAETTEDQTTTEEEDDETTSETEETTSHSWALQITSIIIAIVIILVLIVVIIRMFVKKKTVKETKVNEYYNRDSREITNKKIAANKRRKALEEANAEKQVAKADEEADETADESSDEATEETTQEYDYENMENNIPDDEKSESVVEEAVEEAEATQSSETTETESQAETSGDAESDNGNNDSNS